MIRVYEKAKRQTAAEMMAILKMFTNWFNGTKQGDNGDGNSDPDGQ